MHRGVPGIAAVAVLALTGCSGDDTGGSDPIPSLVQDVTSPPDGAAPTATVGTSDTSSTARPDTATAATPGTTDGAEASTSTIDTSPATPPAELPVTTDVLAPSGSAANPIPFGRAAEVGAGWTAQVNSVSLDAAAEILAQTRFNEPPADGYRYVMANVTVGYLGPDASSATGVRFTMLSASGEDVSMDDSPLVPPNAYLPTTNVPAGGAVTGNVAFSVPEADVDTLFLLARPAGSPDGEATTFSLR